MSKITIIGGGNIGQALALGLIETKKAVASDITITRRKMKYLTPLQEKGFNVSTDNVTAVQSADVVVLAVLPQQLNKLLSEIKDVITNNQLIISVISGVKIKDIKGIIGEDKTVGRAMPNTAIAIKESMTCICAENKEVGDQIKDLFDTVGTTIMIDEEQMTAATALCACGVAFYLRAIRAASQGGIEIGFHAEEALRMAVQTAKGAAALLQEKGTHPEDEIDNVTSPKGCTIAGLNEMEHRGFSSAFIKGIITSTEKAGNLYND